MKGLYDGDIVREDAGQETWSSFHAREYDSCLVGFCFLGSEAGQLAMPVARAVICIKMAKAGTASLNFSLLASNCKCTHTEEERERERECVCGCVCARVCEREFSWVDRMLELGRESGGLMRS
ncbi:hypothetical protein GOP47_0002307 [Adiantum capillus-veneris]|uniref:Uncharacterized protein n=1 Tax=Adiantum capillus-veneris TaxID=13818 RepID=A0A9D4VAP0_ADICA|nr:hypothetical protein GOP47_0002307 [Adiantum capillus-veneris]